MPHKFMYPKEDKENYQVVQFASQAAGSQGLATYMQQISEAAIKVSHCNCPSQLCCCQLHSRCRQIASRS